MALPDFNILDFILPNSEDLEAIPFEPAPEIFFGDNLAEEYLDESEIERIGNMVMDSYTADKESRAEWESMFEKGFELLGLKLSTTSEPFEGACTAVHPLLIESAVKFQSKASEELFPPQGPVKTQIIGTSNTEKEDQSERVQSFMNFQLTEVMPEYFDEFERMLFHLPLVGSAFKKIYYDPASERPVSEFVPVDQFYVSYNATDLRRADRYTHVIYMTPHELQKQIKSGMYRDIDLTEPGNFEPSSMSQTINSIMGIEFNAEYDKQHTLLEQHLYLELDEDEFPSPYIVTIEKDSNQVLGIRRNWNEDDQTREKKMYFTHYKYVPGFGFYGLGLIHFLGNMTMSATLAMRSLLDAGQFANLPGGFKARGIRIVGGDDPIAPGEFKEVEATGMDLNKAIVPLPYKEPSQTLFQLLGFITQAGQKFADSTDAVVSDATNYGPVGTTLALIEASAKLFSAIHKRLHKSQKDELRILARLNYEYLPDERMMIPIPGMELQITRADFDGRIDIIPVSDPNIPSQAHRLAQAQLLLQISAQSAPGTYDMREVHKSLLTAAGVRDPSRFLSSEKEPVPQDPVSDILSASKGLPISAFPGQNHQAYIQVFSSFLQDPTLGQNQSLQSMGPLLQVAITDHMMMQYQETMGGLINEAGAQQGSPDMMTEIMAEAAQQILNANQQLGQYQSLEQQQLALESRNIELKEKGMAQENAKDMADLSLKKQELDIRRRGQDIDAAKDIGVNTIRNKEADNKKDIMLQKFLLEGLGKMRDINLKNTSSGTSPGYKGGGATEIKGYEPGGMVSFDDVISLVNSYENGGTPTQPEAEDFPPLPAVKPLTSEDKEIFEAMKRLPVDRPLPPEDKEIFEAEEELPEVELTNDPDINSILTAEFRRRYPGNTPVPELPSVTESGSPLYAPNIGLTPREFALNMFTDKIGKREDVVPHIDLKGIFTLGWGVVPDKGSVTIELNENGTINTEKSDWKNATKNGLKLSDFAGYATRENPNGDQQAFATAVARDFYNKGSKVFNNKHGDGAFETYSPEARSAMLDLMYNAGKGAMKWDDVKTFMDASEKVGTEDYGPEVQRDLINLAQTENFLVTKSDGTLTYPRGILKRRLLAYNMVAPENDQAAKIETTARIETTAGTDGTDEVKKRTGTLYNIYRADGTLLKTWESNDTTETLSADLRSNNTPYGDVIVE
jgi:chaperonin GroES